MNEAQTPPPAKASKPRHFLRIFLIACGLVLAAHLLLGVWADLRLKKTRQAHTQGSLEFADYIPSDLPEGVVNGTDYEQAAALVMSGQGATQPPYMGKTDPGVFKIYERFQTLAVDRKAPSSDDLEVFRRQIERQSLALAILDEGIARTDDARYLTDWQVVPYQIEIPNLLVRLHMSTLIRARGEVALAEGRMDDAWNDAFAVQRMAVWTYRSLPTLINALIARAIAQHGFLLVERLLAGPAVDEPIRQRVLAEAEKIPWSDHMSTLLNAEVTAAFSTVVDPRTQPETFEDMQAGTNGLGRFQRLLMSSMTWRKLNAAAYLQWAEGYFGLCKRPSHQLPLSATAFTDGLPSSFWGIARLGAFDCTTVSHKRDLAVASVDLFRIALELQKELETEGGYPQTSAGLSRLKDPFTQRPYGYALQPDGGYKLWSASINFEDEDGLLPPASEKGSPDYERGDLVWWVKGPG